MKKESKKDSAVSPVIGTILLVAITVVLVAIISAVVMGMTGNVGQEHTVGAKVTDSNVAGAVDVVLMSGDVKLISPGPGGICVNGKAVNKSDGTTVLAATDAYAIGTTYVGTGIAVGENTDVKVTANFTDGSQQIIWSGKINVR